ncbi:hypothetical protein [Levilactobacillus wangkuiensis]|uniref:hypothetical protein n=1 Tax=Levilactobacillus wangkuiensis TaxID=2799566 RepID=UPI001941DF1F|nr:hypothetical protein [Levilactobacillus wangkuiensis]
MKTIYATAADDKPDSYAVYALDPVPYGADKYIGWKMVKMKQTPALDDNGKQIIGSDGNPQMLCVDDPDAEVTYDPHTQVLKQVDTISDQNVQYKKLLGQTAQAAAKIGGSQAQLKVTVDKANKAMAKIGGQLAQLQVAAKSTDTAATN